MLQDLTKAKDPQILAVVQVIVVLDADVLLLTGVDYDARGEALAAFARLLTAAGADYPHLLPLRPNTGVATGRDLNADGQLGGPRDAQGYGRFAGEGGMAVLSRLPLLPDQMRDFSSFLWADLPDTLMPKADPARDIQRLSSTGHYEIPLQTPNGGTLRLLAFHATPPVFDGPEDRNGRRNHDEAAFWLHLLNGDLPARAPAPPYILLGQTNLDPADGEGRPQAIRSLLSHPALQDPAPRGNNLRQDAGQRGDAALDTALYDKLGGRRVEVILPSVDLAVVGTGVLWPHDDDPLAATLTAASRHRPLWVDVTLPDAAPPLRPSG